MVTEELILEERRPLTLTPQTRRLDIFETDRELEKELKAIPDKMAFKIGEVADILDVKPYVLRYWESEFDQLKPKKSRHNQRMYEKKDVELLVYIKKLLYRDRFSIEGARVALKRLKKDNQKAQQMMSLTEHHENAILELEDLIEHIQHLKSLF
jgi:DNA-binding transcriptional MerR regulator